MYGKEELFRGSSLTELTKVLETDFLVLVLWLLLGRHCMPFRLPFGNSTASSAEDDVNARKGTRTGITGVIYAGFSSARQAERLNQTLHNCSGLSCCNPECSSPLLVSCFFFFFFF